MDMEHFKNCEAREWITRYRKRQLEDGKGEALAWWHKTLADIAKRRGQEAADELRTRMNRLTNEARRKN